jgi:hypothetical protein
VFSAVTAGALRTLGIPPDAQMTVANAPQGQTPKEKL